MSRRDRGDGGIDPRGPNTWRLRYRIAGRRFTATVHGTLSDARKELRRLIRSGDVGEHVAPDKLTLEAWIDRWLALLERQRDDSAPRKRGLVAAKTLERYSGLLRHVTAALGSRPIQQIQASEIDSLYCALEKKLAPRTVAHVHGVFGACLKAAVRKGLISSTPPRVQRRRRRARATAARSSMKSSCGPWSTASVAARYFRSWPLRHSRAPVAVRF
jgi:integrase